VGVGAGIASIPASSGGTGRGWEYGMYTTSKVYLNYTQEDLKELLEKVFSV
jgi:hypothetical protein